MVIGWIDVERLHSGETGLREQPPQRPPQRQAIGAVRPIGHGRPRLAPPDGAGDSPQDATEPRCQSAGANRTPGPGGDRDAHVQATPRPEHAPAFAENPPEDRRKVGAPSRRSPLLERTFPDHAIECLVPIGQRTRAGACHRDIRGFGFARRHPGKVEARGRQLEVVDEPEMPPPCCRRHAAALNVKGAVPARQIGNPEPVAPGMVRRPRRTVLRLRLGRHPRGLSP